jgi:hypothetical protein
MKYYSGTFRPKNIHKYEGDHRNIKYRSLWEYKTLKWCDENPDVVSYSSEEVIIPYRCATDNKYHRYFMDLKIKFKNGQTYLIEIKPKKQTQQPKRKSRITKAYVNEVMTYAKNQSKWKAADELCKDRGWIFEVWTEETLKNLGIKLLT